MKVSKAAALMTGVKEKVIKNDVEINGAFLDSRLVTPNSLFFAVKGDFDNGNLYADRAVEKGAAAVIMTNEIIYKNVDGNKILVNDSLETMKHFGSLRLKGVSGKKIAVTGSFGKTGTKETVKHIFSHSGEVYASIGNKNNELGLALTASGINDEAKYIILEMGTNSKGEIAALSETAQSDIAIIVSVGLAHVGRFGNLDNIIKEKLSITAGLKKGGMLIIPKNLHSKAPKGDYKIITFGSKGDYYIVKLRREGLNIIFEINKDVGEFLIKHPYEHLAENSLSAIAAAFEEGLSVEAIKKGLLDLEIPKGHGNIEQAGALTIINDAYNGGFDSFTKGVASLNALKFDKKYAIFGELGEIDGYESEIYNQIGRFAELYPDIQFYLCGTSYTFLPSLKNREIFMDKEEFLLKTNPIKSGIALVKASNSNNFGHVVNVLKQRAETYAL